LPFCSLHGAGVFHKTSGMLANDIWSSEDSLDASPEAVARSANLAWSMGSGIAFLNRTSPDGKFEPLERIRSRGLLSLTVSRALGGLGGGVVDLFHFVRQLAQGDASLAQAFGLHQLQLIGLQIHDGPAAVARGVRHQREVVEPGLLWASALKPAAGRVRARRIQGGWRLDGITECLGSVRSADRLTLAATNSDGNALLGILPASREGLNVERADSLRLDDVLLVDEELLQLPGLERTPRARLRSQIGQLITANLYLGIAEGAFEAARQHTLARSRPWGSRGVLRAADESEVQQRFADLWLYVRSAQALADGAGVKLQAALARGSALTAQGARRSGRGGC